MKSISMITFLSLSLALVASGTAAQAAPLAPVQGPQGKGGALEIPLKQISRAGDEPRAFIPGGILALKRCDRPPVGKWRFPEWKSKAPIFTTVRLGDQDHLLVMDKKSEESPFFDRILFDADADHDLTDDPVLDGKCGTWRKNRYYADFPACPVTFRCAGRVVDYCFSVRIYQNAAFYMKVLCAWSGEFDWAGSRYRLVLADINANGVFGDTLEKPQRWRPNQGPREYRDRLYITAGDKVASWNGMQIGAFLLLGAQPFRLDIRQGDRKIILTPVAKEMGTLSLSMPVEHINLTSLGDGGGVMMYRPTKKVPLPPGEYGLVSYLAAREDDGGNTWIVACSAPPRGMRQVSVLAHTESALVFGEPYTPTMRVNVPFRRDRGGDTIPAARLLFQIQGLAGEKVTDIRTFTGHKSGVARSSTKRFYPREPEYKITESPGTTVAARGHFRYG